jgi:acyl transferase domain-containing protein
MAQLDRQGVFCRRVQVDVAAHTGQMQGLALAMRSALEGVTSQPGSIGFYSSLHGRLWPGERCGTDYWVENLERPVQFWRALQGLVQDGHRIFVEVSSHPVLGPAIADGLKALKVEGEVRPSLRRGEPERRVMLESLSALYEQGQTVAWQALYPQGGRHVSLPTYGSGSVFGWRRPKTAHDGFPSFGREAG